MLLSSHIMMQDYWEPSLAAILSYFPFLLTSCYNIFWLTAKAPWLSHSVKSYQAIQSKKWYFKAGKFKFSRFPLLSEQHNTHTIAKIHRQISTLEPSAVDRTHCCGNCEITFTTPKPQCWLLWCKHREISGLKLLAYPLEEVTTNPTGWLWFFLRHV